MAKRLFTALIGLLGLASLGLCQKLLLDKRVDVTGVMSCSNVITKRDDAGNLYVYGNSESRARLEKISPAGVVIYRHYMDNPPTGGISICGLTVDSKGIVYCAANPYDDFQFTGASLVYAVAPSGATLWKVQNANYDTPRVAISSKGDLLVCESSSHNVFDLLHVNPSNGSTKSVSHIHAGVLASDLGVSGAALLDDAGGHLYALQNRLTNKFTYTYSLVRLNEIDGAVLWFKTLGDSGASPAYNANYITEFPNGDAVVAGQKDGMISGKNASWQEFWRFGATNGATAYQKEVGQVAGWAFILGSRPHSDSAGRLYFLGTNTNLTTQKGMAYGGELGTTGLPVWTYSNANYPGGVTLVPISTGGAYGMVTPGTYLKFASSGAVSWARVVPGPSPFLFESTAGNLCGAGIWQGDAPSLDLPPHYGAFELLAANGATHWSSSDLATGGISNTAAAIAADPSGNIYALGTTGPDLSVGKYSSAGAPIWRTMLPDGWSVPAQWIAADAGSVYVMCGVNNVLGFAKLNSSTGKIIWSKYYSGGHQKLYVQGTGVDSGGNISALFTPIDNGNPGATQLLKLRSADGAGLWLHNISYPGTALAVDSAGNSYTSGTVAAGSGASGSNLILTKYNTSGVVLYNRTIPVADFFYRLLACMVVLDDSGNAYASYEATNSTYLVKCDSTGKLLFNKSYTTGESLASAGVFLKWDKANASIYGVATNQDQFTGYTDLFSFRSRTSDGVLLWQKKFISPLHYNHSLAGAVVDKAGNLVIAAETAQDYYLATNRNALSFLSYTAATGALKWSFNYSGANSTIALTGAGVQIGPDGDPLFVGTIPSVYGLPSTDEVLVKITP